MIERGYRVSFVTVGEDRIITLPRDYVIAHDERGEYGRRCDIYILPVAGLAPASVAHPNDRASAADLFRGSANLTGGWVEPPEHAWSRLDRVAWIRYDRDGEPWAHPYDPPVWLYEHRRVPAWKVALPDGCVVNERGFVWP